MDAAIRNAGYSQPPPALVCIQPFGACTQVPDDALPDHPSVLWRKRHFPRANARYRVNSILSVLELAAPGLGVGIVPLFLADGRKDVVRLTDALDECETDLWLLTHPQSRHLGRIGAVYGHLAQTMRLP